jgi:hypothetical protein
VKQGNRRENFADAAYPRKCSGGGFGEDAESAFSPLNSWDFVNGLAIEIGKSVA